MGHTHGNRGVAWWVAVVVLVAACLLPVDARKELPVNPPFAQPVQDAIMCDISSAVVLNLNRQVQAMREVREAKRLRVREDDILGIMEHLCNPFTDEGVWIRQVVLKVHRESDGAAAVASSGHVLSVNVLPRYTVCKRTCATVQRMCEFFLDSPDADDLSAVVLQSLDRFEDLSAPEATKAILDKVCFPSERCQSVKEYQDWLRGLAGIDGYTALKEVEQDVVEEVSQDELQMEQMMAGMFREKGQKTSVFGRDEVKKLHAAIAMGDRELAESLDPSMKDMSPEEFAELQTVFATESPFADNAPIDSDDL